MERATVAGIDVLPAMRSAAHDHLGRRYLRAALDSVVRGGASLALYGLTPVVLARALGPHDYGVYATVTSLTAFVAGLFYMGQNSPLHKLLPEYSVSDRARGGALLADVVSLTLAVALLCCAALFGRANWIAAQLYHDTALTNVFRACALLLLATALFNLASSVVAGLQDFQSYNTALLTRSLVLVAAALLGVVLWGLWGALAGQLIALGAGLALLTTNALRRARERFAGLIRPDFSRAVLGPLAAFVLPVFLLTLLNAPGYWWANTLLAQKHGFAAAGRFSAAYALAQLIWLAPLSSYVPAMTFLSEAHAAQRERFGELVGGNARVIWLLTLPLALGIALASPLLLRVLFGAAYQTAAPAAFGLSLTALLMSLVGLFNTALVAAGRIWHGCAITFGWALIFVVTGLVCIPRWGVTGCALTYAVSHLFYFIGTGLYARTALRARGIGAWRLALLTTVAFAAALVIFLVCKGVAFYCAGAALLIALLAAEWRWVCGPAERAALNARRVSRLSQAWG
jgi:O-antigen/teichoic acid export membrane protein